MTKPNKTSISIISLLIVTIFLYIGYDFFIFTPKYEKKVDKLENDFKQLKTYLDTKIPQIDSAINTTDKEYVELKHMNESIN
jgi:hypothetical protein